MNGYITAQELLTYLHSARQVGHTTTMLEGAKDRDCLVIAHSREWSKELAAKGAHITSLSLTEIERGYLRGLRKPLVLDNAALQELLGDLVGTIAVLRKDIADKENKIRLVRSILS